MSKTDINSRNTTLYAYSDRDIQQINAARNARDGYSYYGGGTYGILMGGGTICRDDVGRTIIEMPPISVADLGTDAKHNILNQYLSRIMAVVEVSQIPLYPIKILFPYRKGEFHWNCGEIVISKATSGKYEIECTSHDSFGGGSFEEGIQKEISRFFVGKYGRADIKSLTFPTSGATKVQDSDLACGVYAAIAMHNLKTKSDVRNIYDGVLIKLSKQISTKTRKSDQTLRDEDSGLISTYGTPDAKQQFAQPDLRITAEGKKQHLKLKSEEEKIIKDCLVQLGDIKNKQYAIDKIKSICDVMGSDGYDAIRNQLYNELTQGTVSPEDIVLRRVIFPHYETGADDKKNETNPLLNYILEAYLEQVAKSAVVTNVTGHSRKYSSTSTFRRDTPIATPLFGGNNEDDMSKTGTDGKPSSGTSSGTLPPIALAPEEVESAKMLLDLENLFGNAQKLFTYNKTKADEIVVGNDIDTYLFHVGGKVYYIKRKDNGIKFSHEIGMASASYRGLVGVATVYNVYTPITATEKQGEALSNMLVLLPPNFPKAVRGAVAARKKASSSIGDLSRYYDRIARLAESTTDANFSDINR
ncbi:MAG: hypothetical protein FJX34_01990, partial [Alphaproteobacteria bacterium]|nr:hypothetical protein [Alphaproteobacteria bacterium]